MYVCMSRYPVEYKRKAVACYHWVSFCDCVVVIIVVLTNKPLDGSTIWRLEISIFSSEFNLLKPTGHVMHQQFNIQLL